MSGSQEVQASIDHKKQALFEHVQQYGPTVVAFSGGVDSAVVARAVHEVWGDQSLAATASSASLASGELEEAQQIAELIGIRHEVVRTEEFLVEGYQQNLGDRCFYCKSELYTVLRSKFPESEFPTICNGANLDDLGDHRPGMRAASDHQVRSPLIDAGLNKTDVRSLAQHWNLPIWDKPAMPCLSSRIAHGVEVTPERVQRVDRAEAYLKSALNVKNLRVRHEANDLARIEVSIDVLPRFLDETFRNRLTEEFRRIGFLFVTLDLEGFRSGSMNQTLDLVEIQLEKD
ncbi:tRNA-specific 2-thiouridylase MnmA [Thalassoglobus neptunius]|uniref:tRNA-specific 2-thiouridylase MnmA n=1 Tax=Thalassoglobus neptunius TaxID=1938619 RepID=A0A5C5X4U0_9PLAN|nr:ATP-dependent sacrificial sulfur transferase LarE [Thalassoglobus neptunius]TWT57599.1 tRNA-specific 2-thiouridylase MnmA [Thalassoglobus neptunius]